MAHNPDSPKMGVAAVRQFGAPNLLVFTRSERPPVPTLDVDQREDKNADAVAKQVGGGTKAELRGKSRRSSTNCARVLSSIDWKRNGECSHVTLSYWKHWPRSKEELARVKASLVEWLGRHVACGLWSLEYQVERHEKFGDWVPHWHVLVWHGRGCKFGTVDCAIGRRAVERFEVDARRWWSVFAKNPSEHGVKVTSGDQARGTWYLAMHAAKLAQSPPFAVGRWWGYVNRDVFLSASDIHQVGEVNVLEFVWWARLYRRHTGAKVRQKGQLAQGFSWFLPRAAQSVAAVWIRERIEWERAQRMRRRPPF